MVSRLGARILKVQCTKYMLIEASRRGNRGHGSGPARLDYVIIEIGAESDDRG